MTISGLFILIDIEIIKRNSHPFQGITISAR
jgi:hypothetical protein